MYGADTDEDTNDNDAVNLPPLTEGQTCDLLNAQPEQHFTRAPATYSEASLIKALEDAGIGRPSTYSMMVSVIRQRKYVRVKKRRLVPTRLGQKVTAFLHTHFALIMNQDFTRTMEASLDKIALGNLDTRHFLGSFWSKFEPLVKPWDYAAPRPEPKTTDESCPVCAKGQLMVRSSKKGRFIGCSRYPRCKYSRDINIPAPVLVGKKCPECNAQLCVRSRRNSDDKFVGCTNYPHCRHTENFNSKPASG
jgi:DNA topoisomerase-1